MRPDGHVPDLNDGDDMAVAPFVALYADLFPNNQLFRWLLSDGKEGTPAAGIFDCIPLCRPGRLAYRLGKRRYLGLF